nr:MAG TPA: hypothetical protein [Caudoviricetes sp.]
MTHRGLFRSQMLNNTQMLKIIAKIFGYSTKV